MVNFEELLDLFCMIPIAIYIYWERERERESLIIIFHKNYRFFSKDEVNSFITLYILCRQYSSMIS